MDRLSLRLYDWIRLPCLWCPLAVLQALEVPRSRGLTTPGTSERPRARRARRETTSACLLTLVALLPIRAKRSLTPSRRTFPAPCRARSTCPCPPTACRSSLKFALRSGRRAPRTPQASARSSRLGVSRRSRAFAPSTRTRLRLSQGRRRTRTARPPLGGTAVPRARPSCRRLGFGMMMMRVYMGCRRRLWTSRRPCPCRLPSFRSCCLKRFPSRLLRSPACRRRRVPCPRALRARAWIRRRR
ncbi:hypothetical protein DFP72DRAFT_306654 [Ephemerocybe angulata]|uniref:Uncharacterized protein n=1 Tax=Ephemerocybe angulata TaxID=980116 RepID=A0A8H6M5Y4_9AGAR|nr:hypothetical protein DFP72DRAFT_306654 [Tulosesus angulatus]